MYRFKEYEIIRLNKNRILLQCPKGITASWIVQNTILQTFFDTYSRILNLFVQLFYFDVKMNRCRQGGMRMMAVSVFYCAPL